MARPISCESVFRALAHQTRREIILALRAGERAAGDILPAHLLAKPTLSDHLRVLQRTGVIAYRRRGNSLVYRLNTHALQPIDDFLRLVRKRRAR